ncbi:hypothetical protein FRC07_000958 [Ceratobasidium sp. 392]|nr:hypothetical protein FRC07_000958 [Ceratobasidium sp. 392]
MTRSPPLNLPAAPTSSSLASSSKHTEPLKNPLGSSRGAHVRSRAGPKPTKLTSSESSNTSDSESSSDEDSSDDSDDSNSESESESESSSSSDSSSGSTSSSDKDSPPQPQPISRKPVALAKPAFGKAIAFSFNQPPNPPNPLHPPVPPGQGKQSTKDRNARRRKLQKHKAAGTATIDSRTQSSTSIPTLSGPTSGPETNVITTQVKTAAPIAPAKNANKNKRRGFDQDMASQVATRTVFETAPVSTTLVSRPSSTPAPANSESSLTKLAGPKLRYTHYHVVPPSQLPNLPSNVIVTSVDVEAVDGMEGVGEWFDGEAGVRDVETVDVMEGVQVAASAPNTIDWDLVDGEWEKKWEEFKFVGEDRWKGLIVGTVLGWKDLTIDPATFTPCMRIHLARVTSTPDLASNQIECFFIERPGADNIGFGFGGKYGGEGNEDANAEELGEVRIVSPEDMRSWRILA